MSESIRELPALWGMERHFRISPANDFMQEQTEEVPYYGLDNFIYRICQIVNVNHEAIDYCVAYIDTNESVTMVTLTEESLCQIYALRGRLSTTVKIFTKPSWPGKTTAQTRSWRRYFETNGDAFVAVCSPFSHLTKTLTKRGGREPLKVRMSWDNYTTTVMNDFGLKEVFDATCHRPQPNVIHLVPIFSVEPEPAHHCLCEIREMEANAAKDGRTNLKKRT